MSRAKSHNTKSYLHIPYFVRCHIYSYLAKNPVNNIINIYIHWLRENPNLHLHIYKKPNRELSLSLCRNLNQIRLVVELYLDPSSHSNYLTEKLYEQWFDLNLSAESIIKLFENLHTNVNSPKYNKGHTLSLLCSIPSLLRFANIQTHNNTAVYIYTPQTKLDRPQCNMKEMLYGYWLSRPNICAAASSIYKVSTHLNNELERIKNKYGNQFGYYPDLDNYDSSPYEKLIHKFINNQPEISN